MPVISQHENLLWWWQRVRDKILAPTTLILNRYHVSPDQVTTTAVLIMVGCFALALTTNIPWLAIMGLWLQFIIDGLDGPLARQVSTPLNLSPSVGLTGLKKLDRGTFVDMGADYLSVVFQGLYLIFFTTVGLVISLIYVGLHGIVICLAVYRIHDGRPYKILVRPQLFVFLGLTIDVIYHTNLSKIVVPGAIMLLLLFLVSGVYVVTLMHLGHHRYPGVSDPRP